MIKVNLVFTLLLTSAAGAFSQATYALRVDLGGLIFQNNTVDVDPGPGWKADNLNEQQNGLFLECINGISIKQKLNLGVGVGWLNFEGIQGYSLYGDFQYLPLRSKLTPLIGAKFGTTHIWNQYQDGQSTALVDFSAGISYKLNKKNRHQPEFRSYIHPTSLAASAPPRVTNTVNGNQNPPGLTGMPDPCITCQSISAAPPSPARPGIRGCFYR